MAIALKAPIAAPPPTAAFGPRLDARSIRES